MVHRTPSQSAARPFVIVRRPDDFARLPSRIVAPPVRADAMPPLGGAPARVAPRLVEMGRD